MGGNMPTLQREEVFARNPLIVQELWKTNLLLSRPDFGAYFKGRWPLLFRELSMACSLCHFNDYWRRLSPGFAAFPCVHQVPVLLVHLARSFFLVKTAVSPPLEHGGDADVKADWPHDLVHNQACEKAARLE